MRFILWYLGALCAFLLGIYLLWSDYQIKHEGIIAEAVVRTHERGRAPRWIYVFQVGNQLYVGETRASREPGEKIRVSYLVDDPQTSRDMDDDFWSWSGIFFVVAAGALFLRGAVLSHRAGQAISRT